MNDQLLSLSKIFTERLFRIPDYQRGYAWGEKELSDFWNDLSRLSGDKNHYVGVLTLEPVYEKVYSQWIDDIWLIKSKSYKPFYIVDGQQRLTTSILLIECILEIMEQRDVNKLNYTDINDIYKRFIAESKDENRSKSYIFSYEINNPSFEYLINCIFQGKDFTDITLQETTYTVNLENAKNFFHNKMVELSTDEIDEIYRKITQRFLFNTYEISSDIDVFVTFETMNNRGKQLTHLELLKNRLIYLSTLFEIGNDIKDRMRRDINQCWKDLYHFLGKNKLKQLEDDEFLSAHFKMFFSKELADIFEDASRPSFRRIRWDHIQNEYLFEKHFIPQEITSNRLTPNDIFLYIESLKESIIHWNVINNPELSTFSDETKEYFNKINYICLSGRWGAFPWSADQAKVLLLACLKNLPEEKYILKLLKALERYMFINSFVPYECYPISKRPQIDFEEFVIKFNEGNLTIQGITEKLNHATQSTLDDKSIRSRLMAYYYREGFYRENFLPYFLCEYEYSLMKQSKTNIEKLNRDLFFSNAYDSIEHIYPKNAKTAYWVSHFDGFTQRQRDQLRNSLGNFVILSSAKNSKLGNKSFPEKKENKNNSVGYKYGTYAEIQLTDYADWSAQEILDRGLKFVNFLHNRWGIQIGDGTKKDKTEFLGLTFLLKEKAKI